MRKLLILLLIVLVVCSTAAAYGPERFENKTLDQIMDEFMAEYQLTQDNFSISFYNTVTGESYDFNEKKFSMAASTYKLPLNMYFYEMEEQGLIDPNGTFRWTGMTLAEVHKASILYSNNEVSEAMTGYWNGNYYTYKENMRKYSDLPIEEIDESYYLTNVSCTRMMMDTLKYLYDNQERFPELLGYMKAAMPGQYFQAGVQEYEVAHKYGEVDGFVNDVAIIYTPQPILLAVYTQNIYGAGVCAQAARLLTDYTIWKTQTASGDAAIEQSLAQDVPKLPLDENGLEEQEPTQITEDKAPQEQEPVMEEAPQELPQPEVEQPQELIPETPEDSVAPQQKQPDQEEEASEDEEPESTVVGMSAGERAVWIIVACVSVLSVLLIPFILRRRL